MVFKTKIIVLITGGVLLIGGGLTAAGLTFTNPTTQYGAVNAAFKTEADIKELVVEHSQNTTVIINDNGNQVEASFKDLGLTLTNSEEIAHQVFNDTQLWKIVNWGSTPTHVEPEFEVNETVLNSYIEQHLETYTPVVNADVTYTDGTYVITPSSTGYTVKLDDVLTVAETFPAITETPIMVSEVAPNITDEQAQGFADHLNNLTSSFVFQAGEEQVKPVFEGPLFSWEGKINNNPTLIVNEEIAETISGTVEGLVNREGVANENIVDSQGTILWTTHVGQSKRTLLDNPNTIKTNIIKKLQASDPVVVLNVNEIPAEDINTHRRIEVDLSEQKTYLYENEQLVREYTISSGKSGTPTHTGHFKVRAFVQKQNMGCGPSSSYCTKDVPWVVYFNGDEAFHGAYWHNNFGTPMSHGCVNMRIEEALELYRWAYNGMEVWVHD